MYNNMTLKRLILQVSVLHINIILLLLLLLLVRCDFVANAVS